MPGQGLFARHKYRLARQALSACCQEILPQPGKGCKDAKGLRKVVGEAGVKELPKLGARALRRQAIKSSLHDSSGRVSGPGISSPPQAGPGVTYCNPWLTLTALTGEYYGRQATVSSAIPSQVASWQAAPMVKRFGPAVPSRVPQSSATSRARVAHWTAYSGSARRDSKDR